MRRASGIGLLLLAMLMAFGFARSNASFMSPATIAALLITVGLPAVGGAALLWGGGRRRADRMQLLRQRTIEAEILRMATQQGGRLTAGDVAIALAVSPEEAKATLDDMMTRDLADIGVSEDGVLVYLFHETGKLGSKASARGILE